MAQTLYDKLMAAHVVHEEATTALIYIDRQLIHEVTSPQAFEGLGIAGRKPWRQPYASARGFIAAGAGGVGQKRAPAWHLYRT